MYVDALCNGIDMLPTVPDSIRHDLEKEFEKKGGDWLREKLVKNLNKPVKIKKTIVTDESLEAVYQDIEENLKQKLSTKVSITSKGNGAGKIEIEFYSHDDLEKIMELLSK